MSLYKEYSDEEINEMLALDVDIRPNTTSLRIPDLRKMFRLNSALFDQISSIYSYRKREKYKNILKGKTKYDI